MKTYKEMARDVLRRRDEELQKTGQLKQVSHSDALPGSEYEPEYEIIYPASGKKRRILPAVIVPCAAALAVVWVVLIVRNGGLWGDPVVPPGTNPSHDHPESINSESGFPYTPSVPDNSDLDPGYLYPELKVLNSIPEYLEGLDIFDGGCFTELSETLSMEEVNSYVDSYYGMEFSRLARLRRNWQTVLSHQGLHYAVSDTQRLRVEGVLISETEFSPFDMINKTDNAADIISEINERKALIYYNDSESEFGIDGADCIQAIIEFDTALVRISSFGLSENEFFDILFEFTEPSDGSGNISAGITDLQSKGEYNTDYGVFILDSTPSYLVEREHSILRGNYDLGSAVFAPFTDGDMESYFVLDLHRFSRLHPDWKKTDLEKPGVYVYNGNDANKELTVDRTTVGGREVISTFNSMQYSISNDTAPTVLNISFIRIGIGENSFSPFDSEYYGDSISSDVFSEVNGRKALFFRDAFGAKFALIEMDGTLVMMSATAEDQSDMFKENWKMEDNEFLTYVEEFTRQYGTESIWPWEYHSQDYFSSYLNYYLYGR